MQIYVNLVETPFPTVLNVVPSINVHDVMKWFIELKIQENVYVYKNILKTSKKYVLDAKCHIVELVKLHKCV